MQQSTLPSKRKFDLYKYTISIHVSIDFELPVWKTLKKNIESNKSCILVSELDDPSNNFLMDEEAEITGEAFSNEIINQAKEFYQQRRSGIIESAGKEYFIQVFPRKELLLVIGAAHITADLVSFGNQMGFDTVVMDPRGFFCKKHSLHRPSFQTN